jgi:hypothetical protein
MFTSCSVREISSKSKRKALDRLFCSLVLTYATYQEVTGTDEDNSQIDSWLLVSCSYVNRPDLFVSHNHRRMAAESIRSYFDGAVGLFWRISTRGRTSPVSSYGDAITPIGAERRYAIEQGTAGHSSDNVDD